MIEIRFRSLAGAKPGLGINDPVTALKKLFCRLLKKTSEARRAKNRRAEAYLTSTLEQGD